MNIQFTKGAIMTLRDEAEDEKEGHREHREDTEIHGIV
jgi:hypothetical protein